MFSYAQPARLKAIPNSKGRVVSMFTANINKRALARFCRTNPKIRAAWAMLHASCSIEASSEVLDGQSLKAVPNWHTSGHCGRLTMFERSRVDNKVQSQSVAVPVELTLDDSSILKGDLLMPSTRPIQEVLNGSNVFVEFKGYGKEAQLLAKSTIRAIHFVNAPGAGHLRHANRGDECFDPHQTLGLPAGATHDQIHKAYVTLAKTYHPDRYATADLPDEVRDYLASMARRINLAFQALQESNRIAIRRANPANAPVYTSPPRV